MLVNVHILYLFSHCVSFVLLIIDFIVILHVRLIRVLLKINQLPLSDFYKILHEEGVTDPHPSA